MVKIFHNQNSRRITSRINMHTGNTPNSPGILHVIFRVTH